MMKIPNTKAQSALSTKRSKSKTKVSENVIHIQERGRDNCPKPYVVKAKINYIPEAIKTTNKKSEDKEPTAKKQRKIN